MKRCIISFFGVLATTALVLTTVSCTGGKTKQTNTQGDTPAGIQEAVHTPLRQVIALSDSLLSNRGADTIEMGRMGSGEILIKELTLRNDGAAPLVITGLEKTCDCLDIDYPRAPLKPGEEALISLSFDSKRLTGWAYKTIGLRTSLGAKSYILIVTANIEP